MTTYVQEIMGRQKWCLEECNLFIARLLGKHSDDTDHGKVMQSLATRIDAVASIFGDAELTEASVEHINRSEEMTGSIGPIFEKVLPNCTCCSITYFRMIHRYAKRLRLAETQRFFSLYDTTMRMLYNDQPCEYDKDRLNKAEADFGKAAVQDVRCAEIMRDQAILVEDMYHAFMCCGEIILERNLIIEKYDSLHRPDHLSRLCDTLNRIVRYNQNIVVIISPLLLRQLAIIRRCLDIGIDSHGLPCDPHAIRENLHQCMVFVPTYLHRGIAYSSLNGEADKYSLYLASPSFSGRFRVKYKNGRDDSFGSTRRFQRSDRGLYYLDSRRSKDDRNSRKRKYYEMLVGFEHLHAMVP